MMLLSIPIAIATLVGLVRASASLTTTKKTHCLTSSAYTSPLAPISTLHYHETRSYAIVVKKKITPSTTITPPLVTQTVAGYTIITKTTTLDTKVDTFTVIQTSYTIDVSYTTLTDGTYVTATTTTSVGPLIPANAGFIPIYSGIAADGGNPSKRKRAAPLLANDKRMASQHKLATNSSATPSYPKAVMCNTITDIFSRTTTTIKCPTRTVTKRPSQITSTSTTTFSITQTSVPEDISVTETYTKTSTIPLSLTLEVTVTKTTTTVATTTDPTLTPTFAACQENNIAGYYAPQQGFVEGDPNNDFLDVRHTDSAEACCIRCVEAGTACGASIWKLNGQCYLLATDNTCNPNTFVGILYYQPGDTLEAGSNGNCGQFEFI